MTDATQYDAKVGSFKRNDLRARLHLVFVFTCLITRAQREHRVIYLVCLTARRNVKHQTQGERHSLHLVLHLTLFVGSRHRQRRGV